jgi:SAM-dependent methyltransferase
MAVWMTGDSASAAYAEACAKRARGEERGAVASFLMAFALAPDVAPYRQAAFDVLNVMSGYDRLPPAVMTALERTIRDEAIDLQPLSQVVRNLCAADGRLPLLTAALGGNGEAAENTLRHADWLLRHPIVLGVLARAVNISVPIETVFTALRRHVCLRVARGEGSVFLDTYPDAAQAMVRQCIANRHAWPEAPEETAALTTLIARTDPAALLVRGAYRPLSHFSASEVAALPPALAALRREQDDERQRARHFPELSPLAPGLSAAMRTQYESFPYPRWHRIGNAARRPLRDLLAQAAPGIAFEGIAFEGMFDRDVDILVAGCGTGYPALGLALGLSGARVLAVDISRVSLAYAARKAAECGADNISFAVADILTIDRLPQRFDFIDCSGVLHHMSDPAAGLRSLCALLHPCGVIKVALYSERGRAAEIAAQRFVQDRAIPDTPDGLRRARAELLALPLHHPARPVADTPDFFTLDGLHDLIFNIHESRTSPAGMKRLLADCGLEAIGVDAPPLLGGDAFRNEHPDPRTWADLDAWEGFEARHPNVFAHMIHVWCRRIK